jgi:hypothetical protein
VIGLGATDLASSVGPYQTSKTGRWRVPTQLSVTVGSIAVSRVPSTREGEPEAYLEV